MSPSSFSARLRPLLKKLPRRTVVANPRMDQQLRQVADRRTCPAGLQPPAPSHPRGFEGPGPRTPVFERDAAVVSELIKGYADDLPPLLGQKRYTNIIRVFSVATNRIRPCQHCPGRVAPRADDSPCRRAARSHTAAHVGEPGGQQTVSAR